MWLEKNDNGQFQKCKLVNTMGQSNAAAGDLKIVVKIQ